MILPRLQLGLRRLLLFLVICAAWFAYFGNEFQRSTVNANLVRTLKSTRSLDVQDTSRITAQTTSFMGGNRWTQWLNSSKIAAYKSIQCFLPNSGWEICIATRDFPAEGFPKASETAPLRKGTSEIEFTVSNTENEYEIIVRIEGTRTFLVREDRTWCNSATLNHNVFTKQILQSDDDSPIELTRLESFNAEEKKPPELDTPSVTNGVLIWLRKIGDQ